MYYLFLLHFNEIINIITKYTQNVNKIYVQIVSQYILPKWRIILIMLRDDNFTGNTGYMARSNHIDTNTFSFKWVWKIKKINH